MTQITPRSLLDTMHARSTKNPPAVNQRGENGLCCRMQRMRNRREGASPFSAARCSARLEHWHGITGSQSSMVDGLKHTYVRSSIAASGSKSVVITTTGEQRRATQATQLVPTGRNPPSRGRRKQHDQHRSLHCPVVKRRRQIAHPRNSPPMAR